MHHLFVLKLLADLGYITSGVCVNQYFLVFYQCILAYTGNNISNQSDIPYWLLFCLTGSQNEKAQRVCGMLCVFGAFLSEMKEKVIPCRRAEDKKGVKSLVQGMWRLRVSEAELRVQEGE